MKPQMRVLDAITDIVLAYKPKSKQGAADVKPRVRRELRVIELCAGGGGSALGFEQAGFTHTALIDNDSHACATLRRNRPYWNVIEADMRRFDASYWCGVDLLSGGLPCPPFSIAGKQLGADDDRDMFPAMLRIVREVQPRAVVIENVRGILTKKFEPFRAKIEKQLSNLGFNSQWREYNAVDFGVPQLRSRAFLIALKSDSTAPLEWPKGGAEACSVGEALSDLMGSGGWRGVKKWVKIANAPGPTIVGGSKKHGGPDLGPTRARKEWAVLGVDGIGIANEPPARNFSGMPRLTVPMVARLQSFPDEWIFAGAKTNAYRQVGNALPVKLAYRIAKAVKKCLEV